MNVATSFKYNNQLIEKARKEAIEKKLAKCKADAKSTVSKKSYKSVKLTSDILKNSINKLNEDTKSEMENNQVSIAEII